MRITLIAALLLLGCVQPIGQHHGHTAPDAGSKADASGDGTADAGPTPRSCKDAFDHGVVADGVLTIDPDGDGAEEPFQVYCNMTAADGGWTLVWSYNFTNYGNFGSSGNAVTPRPDWGNPSGGGAVPLSTTTPTNPDTQGAMAFAQWKELGTEFLITSNINHWIDCTPGTGSLVTMTQGSLNCNVVKAVATVCTTTAPNTLQLLGNSPTLRLNGNNNNYYYFDSSQANYWPTHDPCGTNQTNQVNGVANAGGAIYVR
jgi:fibrinogen beta/gamma subunit family protein